MMELTSQFLFKLEKEIFLLHDFLKLSVDHLAHHFFQTIYERCHLKLHNMQINKTSTFLKTFARRSLSYKLPIVYTVEMNTVL